MVNELHQSIDDLSNLKSLRQLEIETLRAKELSVEMEKKTKVHEYRVEQAQQRMKQIEEDDQERCRKTAAILKEFEEQSGNGPFFESLLNILINYQGKKKKKSSNLQFQITFVMKCKILPLNSLFRWN